LCVIHSDTKHPPCLQTPPNTIAVSLMGYDDCAERTTLLLLQRQIQYTCVIRCVGYGNLDRRSISSSPVAHSRLREHHSCKASFCVRWFTTALLVAATRVTTIFDIVPGFGETFAPRKRTPTGDAWLCGQVLFFDTAHRKNP